MPLSPTMLSVAEVGPLPLPWLIVIVAVIGTWLVLRLVATETEVAKAHLLAEHQRLLYEQLAHLKQQTKL